VVHPASGDTLFSHNAAQLLVPASNTKIVTGAVALATLGPDYRWTTRVSSTGELRNGVISGNLVVTGRGDPTVSSRLRGDAMTPLREMADSLAARGIRRIAGRIVKGGDAFPDANIGPGWQWDYLASGYAAGVDELFFNEGTVRIVVRGAPVAGAPPAIITSPARSFPLVKVLALTRQPVDSVRTRIALQVDSRGVGVTVTGYIAPGDSSVQTVVLQDPATASRLSRNWPGRSGCPRSSSPSSRTSSSPAGSVSRAARAMP
jgi:D-alanyl-D-alanine carboxypeptidase/D-alanyl-D-alanine-endopeptidase (penicillin-binding protein 4)